MDWKKGLNDAPHLEEDGPIKVIVWEPGSAPATVIWRDHEEEIEGQTGYWDYEEELVSDVTGGIERPEDLYWAVMDFGPVMEMAKREDASPQP